MTSAFSIAAPPIAAGPPAPRTQRILFVDHTAAMGGGELALLELVRRLDRSRYQPLVVLFSHGALEHRLRQAGIDTRVMPLDDRVVRAKKNSLGIASLLRPDDVAAVLRHVLRLARLIRRQRIDLVHANSLKADLIAGAAARLAGVPVIWHVRDRIADDYLPPRVARAFRILCRVLPTRLVANSHATRRSLRLARPDRCAVVYSGIDPGCLSAGPPPRTTADGTFRVGLVGRLARWKGQHIFLRAAAQIAQRFPQCRFQIIGAALFDDRDYEAELRRLAASLGIADRVEFLGHRNDVLCLMAQLDVLVHASITGEPFGQVVVQGMAQGRPVVATDGGGVREIVRHGVSGLLVPMGDADAMAHAVCRLLADPALAATLGRAARACVLERFTIDRTVAQVQALYAALLRRRRRGQPP